LCSFHAARFTAELAHLNRVVILHSTYSGVFWRRTTGLYYDCIISAAAGAEMLAVVWPGWWTTTTTVDDRQ